MQVEVRIVSLPLKLFLTHIISLHISLRTRTISEATRELLKRQNRYIKECLNLYNAYRKLWMRLPMVRGTRKFILSITPKVMVQNGARN